MPSAVPALTWRASLVQARQRRAVVALGVALALALALAPASADAAPAPSDEPEDTRGVDEAPADSTDEPATDVTTEDPDDDASDELATDATTEDPDDDATTEDTNADDGAASDEPGPEEGPEEDPEEDPDTGSDTDPDAEPIRPPRIDGPYIGVLAIGTANFASVLNHDTPSPLLGAGGFLQAGDAVFPWMSIGVSAGGQAAWIGDQQLFEGALLVEFGFVPIGRYPLSIRAGFGFGGGALTQAGIDERSGFGGALFKGALRYEFFPLAQQKRKDRGGGWAIGPELGWLGATPAGKGQPFVNTILLGLSTSFYFGS